MKKVLWRSNIIYKKRHLIRNQKAYWTGLLLGEIDTIAAVTTDIGGVEILIIGQLLPITIFSPVLLMILAKQTFFCTNVKNRAFFSGKVVLCNLMQTTDFILLYMLNDWLYVAIIIFYDFQHLKRVFHKKFIMSKNIKTGWLS